MEHEYHLSCQRSRTIDKISLCFALLYICPFLWISFFCWRKDTPFFSTRQIFLKGNVVLATDSSIRRDYRNIVMNTGSIVVASSLWKSLL